MFGRRKVATYVAEFLGTGALTLLILSVQRSTIGVPFFVAAAAGLTIALMVFAIGNISGGFFNPALTLGFWTARKIESVTAVIYIAAQFLGGWGAYYLYTYLVKSSLQPVGGHFAGRILVAEAVGTAIFSFGVAAAVYQGFSRAVTASFAGLALMIGVVAASPAAIGLLNPAVALGVRAWVWGTYVLGPVLGAIIGVNLYALLFAEPEKANAKATSATAAPAVRSSAKKKTSKAKK
ncbi:MAG TPA: aquaporin [Candidatus Dormibacteraeota bacterium]|nr:aquaporin [Candidatus Dormibacteraeota bacterium]